MTKRQQWFRASIILGVLALMLMAVIFSRENVLQISSDIERPIFAGVLPIAVVALLCFFFVADRRRTRAGLSLGINARRPFRYALYIVFGPLFGLYFAFSIQSGFGIAMDRLNETPVSIQSVVSGVGWSKQCRVLVHVDYKGNRHTKLCIQRTWPVRPLITSGPIEKDQQVVLIGRSSWAGIVVDEIRPAPEQSSKQVSSGGNPHLK